LHIFLIYFWIKPNSNPDPRLFTLKRIAFSFYSLFFLKKKARKGTRISVRFKLGKGKRQLIFEQEKFFLIYFWTNPNPNPDPHLFTLKRITFSFYSLLFLKKKVRRGTQIGARFKLGKGKDNDIYTEQGIFQFIFGPTLILTLTRAFFL